ncbi:MAG: potassium channel family protein [Desulfobacterales bacterium]
MAVIGSSGFWQRSLRRIRRERFLFLLVALLVLLLLSPLLRGLVRLHQLMNLCYTLVLLAAVYAVSQSRRQLVSAALLALPMLVTLWAAPTVKIPHLENWGLAFGSAFLAFVLVMILGHIARCRRIERDLLFGAIVVYLLMGLMWAFAFELLEGLTPGAFKFPESPIGEDPYRFVYFSFVTLATLGYGDMIAATPLAGALSILEAVIGQMYLVVGVGWLVGIHISQKIAEREGRGAAGGAPAPQPCCRVPETSPHPLADPAVSSKPKEALK